MLNPFLIWLKYKKALESGGGSSDCIHTKYYDVYVQTQDHETMPSVSLEGLTFQKVREAFTIEKDAHLTLRGFTAKDGDDLVMHPQYVCGTSEANGSRIGRLLIFQDEYNGDNMICGFNVPEEYLGIMLEEFGIEFPEPGFYVLADYASIIMVRWTISFINKIVIGG